MKKLHFFIEIEVDNLDLYYDVEKEVEYLPRVGDRFSFEDFIPLILQKFGREKVGSKGFEVMQLVIDILVSEVRMWALGSGKSTEDYVKSSFEESYPLRGVLTELAKCEECRINFGYLEVTEVSFRDGKLPSVVLTAKDY